MACLCMGANGRHSAAEKLPRPPDPMLLRPCTSVDQLHLHRTIQKSSNQVPIHEHEKRTCPPPPACTVSAHVCRMAANRGSPLAAKALGLTRQMLSVIPLARLLELQAGLQCVS